jgi:hypothetical protein
MQSNRSELVRTGKTGGLIACLSKKKKNQKRRRFDLFYIKKD